MRLAGDEITVRVEGQSFHLRPSLRAAARLERRFGFPALYRGVIEGSITIMEALIREGARDPSFELIGSEGFAIVLPLRAPLLDFVLALNGLDEDAEPEPDGDATKATVTFAEHHERLFRLATGWLGWPPETALDATANEITEAYLGRLDMLRAIFGGETPADERSVDDKFADWFRKQDEEDRLDARERDREARRAKLLRQRAA